LDGVEQVHEGEALQNTDEQSRDQQREHRVDLPLDVQQQHDADAEDHPDEM